MRIAGSAVAIAVVVFVGACTSGSDDARDGSTTTSEPEEAAFPTAIRCSTQYRPGPAPGGGKQERQVTVEPVDFPGPAEPGRLEFETMALEVTYLGESPDSGHTVGFLVFGADGARLAQSTYYLPDDRRLVDDFGGFGFTGANDYSDGDANLQVSCEALY